MNDMVACGFLEKSVDLLVRSQDLTSSDARRAGFLIALTLFQIFELQVCKHCEMNSFSIPCTNIFSSKSFAGQLARLLNLVISWWERSGCVCNGTLEKRQGSPVCVWARI
ncbi:hypothetical protein AKJ16_DCAP20496 [Drosera capensis]